MNYSIIYKLIALGVIFTVASCESNIDLDPGEAPVVALNCILKYPDDVQTLTLEMSSVKTSVPAGEAIVTLTDSTEGIVVGLFERSDAKNWKLDKKVVPGHVYTIGVLLPGRETVRAATRVPDIQPPTFKRSLGSAADTQELAGYPVGCMCYNLADDKDTFYWVYVINYQPLTDKGTIVPYITSDCKVLDDFNETGETYIAGAGYEIYSFLEGRPLYDKYLRINGVGEHTWFTIAGDYEGEHGYTVDRQVTNWYFSYPDRCGYIAFMSVSKEYDEYLKEVIKYKTSHEKPDDITLLYDRHNIYTNVSGGRGVFGASVTYYLPSR